VQLTLGNHRLESLLNFALQTLEHPPPNDHSSPFVYPPIRVAHHESLMFPNGRLSSPSGNGIALPSRPLPTVLPPNSAPPTQYRSETPLPPHHSLLTDIYTLMHHISSLLPFLYEKSNEASLPFSTEAAPPNFTSQSSPSLPPSLFPPLSQPSQLLSSESQGPHSQP